jgi:SAM-dependent methyltransferase
VEIIEADETMSKEVNMDQKDIWARHTENIQRQLADFINTICHENDYKKVMEIGCESGITTMLLSDTLDKTFLDYNPDILGKVEQTCRQLNIKGHFLEQDMFSMTMPAGSYDLIFNSGVIEHYTFDERVDLLKSYARILSDQGSMVLAIPNHYCLPYRSAYVLKKEWLKSKRWPWPAEFKIYDMKAEVEAASLQLVKRTTMDRDSALTFWRRAIVRKLIKLADHLFEYEGYLTTLVIKKK